MTAWSIISETAALRRDGASFAKVLLIRPESRNICVPDSPSAQYLYWARFFNEIVFDDENSQIVYKRNDKRHRADGPAVEHANGDEEWYVDDKPHRIDGPAIQRVNGYSFWYIDGELIRYGVSESKT